MIAEWREGEAGYPCTLITGERRATCEDAGSLEQELAELVSSAPVGEAIVAAMNFEPTVQNGHV
jgi:hypothetical protein